MRIRLVGVRTSTRRALDQIFPAAGWSGGAGRRRVVGGRDAGRARLHPLPPPRSGSAAPPHGRARARGEHGEQPERVRQSSVARLPPASSPKAGAGDLAGAGSSCRPGPLLYREEVRRPATRAPGRPPPTPAQAEPWTPTSHGYDGPRPRMPTRRPTPRPSGPAAAPATRSASTPIRHRRERATADDNSAARRWERHWRRDITDADCVGSAVGALASGADGRARRPRRRVRLLALMVAVWGVALGIAGAGPVVPVDVGVQARPGRGRRRRPARCLRRWSATSSRSRSGPQVYSWILTGEIAGAGSVLARQPGHARLEYPFWLFAVLGLALALPCGGGCPSGPGRRQPDGAGRDRHRDSTNAPAGRPRPDHGQPLERSVIGFWYVVRTPTNRILIIASAVGYFFFAGLRTFRGVLVRHQYQVDTFTISVLALVVGAGAGRRDVPGGSPTCC